MPPDIERQAREMQQFSEVPKDRDLHGPAVGESPRLAATGIAHEVSRVGRFRLIPSSLNSVRNPAQSLVRVSSMKLNGCPTHSKCK
jgi:hypothetical protein